MSRWIPVKLPSNVVTKVEALVRGDESVTELEGGMDERGYLTIIPPEGIVIEKVRAQEGDGPIRLVERRPERVTFPLSLPPTLNHAYFTDKKGRRLLTAEAKAWIEIAKWDATLAARNAGWTKPLNEKVVVELSVFWPDSRRRDMNNLHKLLADALEGSVYTDDKWALLRDMDFDVDRAYPHIEITCYPKEGS